MAPTSGSDGDAGEPEGTDEGEAADSLAALHTAREEARETLDHQLTTLDDIDSKALGILRLDAALVGLLVSVFTLAARTDLPVGEFVNVYVGVGIAALVGSTVAAAATYTVAAQVGGIAPRALDRAPDLSERAFHARLVAGYADWIRFNRRTNARKAPLVTLAVFGVVLAAVFLSLGALAALARVTRLALLAAGATFAVAVYASGLHRQLRRLREPETGEVTVEAADFEPFAGQRTFKGDERRPDRTADGSGDRGEERR